MTLAASPLAVTEPIDAELLDHAVRSDRAFSEVIFYSQYFHVVLVVTGYFVPSS